MASKRLDPEPTPTGVLSALATSPFLRAAFTNSAYLRVDVLGLKLAEAPLPDSGSCSSDLEGDRGARAVLTLSVSNYSPIAVRGWRMAVMAGDAPAQTCLLGVAADGRLPAIEPGTRRDIVVVAYAPIDAAFTRIEAQWQGERYAVCADNGPVALGCAPQSVPIAKTGVWAPTPLPDFSKVDDAASLQAPEAVSATTTATPTAVPVPTPTPTRAPANWSITAQSLDASVWGRPIQASCFAYDDGDPVTRWQASLRVENLSPSEMRDLRVTFFEGETPLRTCFHGYGGFLPNIPPSDGRNISFFAFVEKGRSLTSVLVEAMGQSRRMCVAGGTLTVCK